ncbi:MAG: hypothetical protein PVH89_10535 [Gammaproteobacteria bacterium]
MRSPLILIPLLVLPLAATAQSESDGRVCRVVSGSPDVNEAGELVRPVPTDEQCSRALALEAKFLATRPRDFRIVRNTARLPEPVRLYIAGIDGLDGRRGPVNVQVGHAPRELEPIVVWVGTELVVLAYRVSDFAGTTTTVVLGDLDSLTACAYLRWRGGELPAALSIEDIQDELGRGRLGNRQAPACHLGTLPLD